jgi:prolyl-tRNA synthetase
VRALLDLKWTKAATKRWGWVKKGAPVVIEVGGRDMAGGNVSVIRRDRLYRDDGKLDSAVVTRGDFVDQAVATLEDIQTRMFDDARARRDAAITRDVSDWAGLVAFFEKGGKGLLEVNWSKPSGAELDAIAEKIKALKLTLRNVPLDAGAPTGDCVFTGRPAVERILVGRAY